ncbi:MAG: N-acetyltransferase [Dehalococcoidia bacterium]|nr:N-acetyltransferase [Dehalococcoidia bacterium]
MDIDDAALPITDNTAKSRLEIDVHGDVAQLEYERMGDYVVCLHTSVPEAFRRQGLGNRLAQHLLEHAREQGLRVVPLCPFVRYYVNRHPEYAAIVAEA